VLIADNPVLTIRELAIFFVQLKPLWHG
ncbi:uncharacterized protein METZ01_LOCUS206689, partial [marine metagenome]